MGDLALRPHNPAHPSRHHHFPSQAIENANPHDGSLHLNDLPPSFSISAYLTRPNPSAYSAQFQPRIPHNTPTTITQTIHPTHLLALALNEECRIWGYGQIFHLPLAVTPKPPPPPQQRLQNRSQDFEGGHPTDLVYFPRIWSEEMKRDWDGANWGDRLWGCGVGKSGLRGIDSVIPICARIVGFGRDGNSHDDNGDDGDDDDLELEGHGEDDSIVGDVGGLTAQFFELCTSSDQLDDQVHVLRAPGVEAFPNDGESIDVEDDDGEQRRRGCDFLRPSFKPPSKSTSINYIRRTEDISRYILLYPSLGSLPLFTSLRSFQDDSHCLITRTHPHCTESLRYRLNFHSRAILSPDGAEWEDRKVLEIDDVDCRAKVAEEAFLASIRRVGNRDVVRALWWLWHSLEDDGTNEGRMGRVSWQECRDIVGDKADCDIPIEDGWFEEGSGGVLLA